MRKNLIAIGVLLFCVVGVDAAYYNVVTHEKSERLPKTIILNGKGLSDPSLKDCAVIGWREMPEAPKAETGSVITSISYVQDTKDPLKVKAIVTTKTDAQLADEKAVAEAAAQTAKDEYQATRKAERDAIMAPFTDKEQAEAIGKLYDLVRREL